MTILHMHEPDFQTDPMVRAEASDGSVSHGLFSEFEGVIEIALDFLSAGVIAEFIPFTCLGRKWRRWQNEEGSQHDRG